MASIVNGSESFIEFDCNTDEVEHCSSKNLLMKSEVDVDARDGNSGGNHIKSTLTERLLLARELDSNYTHFFASEPFAQGGQNTMSNFQVLDKYVLSSTTETINNDSYSIKPSTKCEVESGSVTHDAISPIATGGRGRDRGQRSLDCQQNFDTENPLSLEDGISESSTVSRENSIIQHSYDEFSNFCIAGPHSVPETSSGLISYSGRVSLRSTSSSASTQSFAFPILQSEWNESPTRMVKAESRQSTKQQRWRMSFLCCKSCVK